MALTLSVRYDTKTRVVSPPGPGDMPFVVIDVTILTAGGNAYPLTGEPVEFGVAAALPALRLFQEVHAVVPTPVFNGLGALVDGACIAGFERTTTTGGLIRLFQATPLANGNLSQFPAAAYSTVFTVADPTFTLLLAGRPLTDAS